MIDYNKLGELLAEEELSKKKLIDTDYLEVHADADVWAYDCANLEETLETNWTELKKYIDYHIDRTQCNKLFLHLTLGFKAGREYMATIQAYQANRQTDPTLKERVKALRQLMAKYHKDNIEPIVSLTVEADDTMATMHKKTVKEKGVKCSALLSIDKDLWRISGYHIHPKTFEVYEIPDGYGYLAYKEVGNKEPKLMGFGRKWFWYQMLVGDKADNILGVGQISGHLADLYFPLKTKQKTPRKPLSIGETRAETLMSICDTEEQAFWLVFDLYIGTYGDRLGKQHMFENAYLLYIREEGSPHEAINYLNGLGLRYEYTDQQREAINRHLRDEEEVRLKLNNHKEKI
jgi:hypothetical protein